MSYDKIKHISIDKKNMRISVDAASSNVRPTTYFRDYYPIGSVEDGERVILRKYWTGDYARGSNKYRSTAKLFHADHPEYSRLTVGDKVGEEDDWYGTKVVYGWGDLCDMLVLALRAYEARDKSKKWVVKTGGHGYYLYKITTRRTISTYERRHAKVFPSHEDARAYITGTAHEGEMTIEQLEEEKNE